MTSTAETTPPAALCAALRDAADRLIAGTPVRSDGKLTIKSLAEEAGVKRWLLVNKYPRQLKDRYDAEFRQYDKKSEPSRQAEEKINVLRCQLAEARAETRRLTAVNKTYARIIDQLATERAATGVDGTEQTDAIAPDFALLRSH
ncbi:MAG: hypothetical protein ACR2LX_02885 [Jatrophihabitans sp.]